MIRVTQAGQGSRSGTFDGGYPKHESAPVMASPRHARLADGGTPCSGRYMHMHIKSKSDESEDFESEVQLTRPTVRSTLEQNPRHHRNDPHEHISHGRRSS